VQELNRFRKEMAAKVAARHAAAGNAAAPSAA
jgi:hypothetical protein